MLKSLLHPGTVSGRCVTAAALTTPGSVRTRLTTLSKN